MAILPRAILFDLDDTILVAFGPAQSQWQRTMASLPAARRRLPLRLNADSGHSCVASNRSNPSPSGYQSNAKR
jgi:hypothetical protein